jgi:hypothetical protein
MRRECTAEVLGGCNDTYSNGVGPAALLRHSDISEPQNSPPWIRRGGAGTSQRGVVGTRVTHHPRHGLRPWHPLRSRGGELSSF